MTTAIPAPSLRVLVAGLVDYAGLFPPAGLTMPDAVERYARYLDSPDAWILGRFVVPTARLDELAEVANTLSASAHRPLHLSALVGEDADGDAPRIRAFNAGHVGRLVVDAAEAKADTPERIADVTRALAGDLDIYLELPYEPDPLPLVASVARAGVRAKIRTGGTAREAFPSSAQIARFLVACNRHRVPFKATAGLHHPLRGDHPLTYLPGAPSATMFGFLNVFVAAALASTGVMEPDLVAALEERHPSAFAFAEGSLRWRHREIALDHLIRTRSSFALAFGSCSFQEPVDDLRKLALL